MSLILFILHVCDDAISLVSAEDYIDKHAFTEIFVNFATNFLIFGFLLFRLFS